MSETFYDGLPYFIEFDGDAVHGDKPIARLKTFPMAHAAWFAALAEFGRDHRFTMRHGARVMRQHPPEPPKNWEDPRGRDGPPRILYPHELHHFPAAAAETSGGRRRISTFTMRSGEYRGVEWKPPVDPEG